MALAEGVADLPRTGITRTRNGRSCVRVSLVLVVADLRGRTDRVAARRAGISLSDIAEFLASPSIERVDEWRAALEAEVADRRRLLDHVSRLTDPKEPTSMNATALAPTRAIPSSPPSISKPRSASMRTDGLRPALHLSGLRDLRTRRRAAAFLAHRRRRSPEADVVPSRRHRHRRVYDEMREAGVVHPNGALCEQPWGMKEFSVLDSDGNLINFGNAPSPDNGFAANIRQRAATTTLASWDRLARAHVRPRWEACDVAALPSGTVTFLFTDLEGSTALWEQCPEAMSAALARHDELLREVIRDHTGTVFSDTGDGLAASFERATDAARAAVAIQSALAAEPWPDLSEPLRVRIGIHTGEAEVRDANYFGTAVNRAARVMAIGWGGQILCTATTAALLVDDLALCDLGDHRLRGLSRPERVWQLDVSKCFPPLRSGSNLPGNLPTQLTDFIGRKAELRVIHEAIESARIVTLTGVGGAGKTRLALHSRPRRNRLSAMASGSATSHR